MTPAATWGARPRRRMKAVAVASMPRWAMIVRLSFAALMYALLGAGLLALMMSPKVAS